MYRLYHTRESLALADIHRLDLTPFHRQITIVDPAGSFNDQDISKLDAPSSRIGCRMHVTLSSEYLIGRRRN
jgi:hypothetical protein